MFQADRADLREESVTIDDLMDTADARLVGAVGRQIRRSVPEDETPKGPQVES